MLRHARQRTMSVVGALLLAAGIGVSSAGSAAAVPVPVTVTVSPASGAYSVSTLANVVATFNLNVTGVDGTSFSLANAATGASVPAVVTYNGTTKVAVLNPSVTLASDTVYRATLSNAIRSGSEYLPPTTWTFTTGLPPVAQYKWPTPASTAVEPWTIAQITFNEIVTGVTSSTFTLTNNSTGAVIPATVSTDFGRVWRLQPAAQIPEDTWFTVKVTGGLTAIRDLAGNPFASTSWTFLSGLRPLLQTWNVAPNATGISTSTTLTMGFSEAITGITPTTFTLKVLATDALVPASVTWSSGTGKWVLTPSAPLAAGTQYRLTLTGGTAAIRDLAGNPLASMAWNFTTA